MQYTICKPYFTKREGTYHPYGSNGSLNFLAPHYHETMFFFLSLPNEMQYTICKPYFTERERT